MINKLLSAVRDAFAEFKNSFAQGKTTDQLWDVFSRSLEESLGEYEILYDYIWGPDSVNVDGVTKNYLPKTGDTVIMDISVGKDGKWCDVTRTFFVGEISSEQREVFQLVVGSLRAGTQALKEGAKASDVFNAVNAVYKSSGKELIHHAGHKIGSKALLQPQFLLDNDTPLEVGQTYAIESGLYDRFGIRLENDFLLTEKGAEDLFESLLPLNIEEYILR